MKFFKDNSYDIVKLFVNQIGIAIFSLALYTAISIAVPENFEYTSLLQILVSAFAIGFYAVLLYVVMWEIGAKDAIRIETGKMDPIPTKGILMGLLANVPNFVICGIALICKLLFLSFATDWLESIFAILNLIFGFIESMYLGIIINIFPVAADATKDASDLVFTYRTAAYFVAPVIAVGATGLAYYLGSKNIKLLKIFSKK